MSSYVLQIKSLLESYRGAIGLLKRIEWVEDTTGWGTRVCLFCSGEELYGHERDCELAEILVLAS